MVVAVGDEEQNKLCFNMSGNELDVFRLATDACGSAPRHRRPSSSHRGTNILCSCLRGLAWQLPVMRKPMRHASWVYALLFLLPSSVLARSSHWRPLQSCYRLFQGCSSTLKYVTMDPICFTKHLNRSPIMVTIKSVFACTLGIQEYIYPTHHI
ncbi:hypothetical protein EDD85DRAFT_501768 [Armillaria nabsnona]|nr:hypothetical protein EDD85DRAFT_501768 [Armillaria nabsnona]